MNLLGVHLGADEDLMEATEQNERGFWENTEIYRLNEDLLGVLGGSDELGVQLTRQRQRLEAIKRSNSWRMTAPLRSARRRVRRHPGVRRDYVTRG